MRPPQSGFRLNIPQQRRTRLNIPQQPKGRLNIPRQPFGAYRGKINVPPPSTKRRGFNIPRGGGVFRPPHSVNIKSERRPLNIPKRPFSSGVQIPKEPPIKRTRFNFGNSLFMQPRQPYEEVEETRKIKRYKKKRR